jgi:hypothetical protein
VLLDRPAFRALQASEAFREQLGLKGQLEYRVKQGRLESEV